MRVIDYTKKENYPSLACSICDKECKPNSLNKKLVVGYVCRNASAHPDFRNNAWKIDQNGDFIE